MTWKTFVTSSETLKLSFGKLKDLREETYMDVEISKILETAIELIMEGHFQEDLDLFKQIKKMVTFQI
jgi:hypothetical protein